MNSPTFEHSMPRTAPYVKVSFFFVVACALLAWRAPDSLTMPQFWAEDGVVFFQQQFGHELPQLFTTYAGYLHVTPRLVAWLATIYTYAYQPFFYNIIALIIGAASITYFACRTSSLTNPWIILLAFAFAPTNGEEFGTITNIQWLLQFALVASCLCSTEEQDRSATKQTWQAILLLIMSLTGPFSIFCAAIMVVIFVARHFAIRVMPASPIIGATSTWWNKLNKTSCGIVVLGALIQACAIVFSGTRGRGKYSLAVAREFLSEGLQRHILGTLWLHPAIFMGLILIPIVALLCLAYFRRSYSAFVLLGMVAFALAQILSISYKGNDAIVDVANMSGDRYYFFVKIVLWMAVATAIGELTSWRRRYQAGIALALIAIAMLSPATISRRSLENLHWREQVSHLDERTYPVEIPINPSPWKIQLIRPN